MPRPEMSDAWEAFILSPQCPAHTMDFYQLDGFLRALCCAPEPMPAELWMARVFNDQEPTYRNSQESAYWHSMLVELYQFHCDEVTNHMCNLPCDASYASLQEERVDLEQWARGFLQGYIVREELWSRALNRVTNSQADHKISDNEFFDEFDAILSIVSTVADAKYAVHMGTDPESLVDIFESLPDSVVRLGTLGRRLSEVALADKSPEMSVS